MIMNGSLIYIRRDTGHYAYNLLKTVQIPDTIAGEMVEYIRITGDQSWTQVSFNVYGTIKLWWLICITNKILNPVVLPAPGMIIKLIKRKHVPTIISEIENQL